MKSIIFGLALIGASVAQQIQVNGASEIPMTTPPTQPTDVPSLNNNAVVPTPAPFAPGAPVPPIAPVAPVDFYQEMPYEAYSSGGYN
jgi:hypothetical protein